MSDDGEDWTDWLAPVVFGALLIVILLLAGFFFMLDVSGTL